MHVLVQSGYVIMYARLMYSFIKMVRQSTDILYSLPLSLSPSLSHTLSSQNSPVQPKCSHTLP